MKALITLLFAFGIITSEAADEIRILELQESTAAADGDWLIIYDISSSNPKFRRISGANLRFYMTNGLPLSSGSSTTNFSGVVVTNFVRTLNATADRVLILDASQNITNSVVTATELGYLSGVTGLLEPRITNFVDKGFFLVGTEGIDTIGDFTTNRNVRLAIQALAEETSPDAANDLMVIWDASSGTHKSLKPSNFPGLPSTLGDPGVNSFYGWDEGGNVNVYYVPQWPMSFNGTNVWINLDSSILTTNASGVTLVTNAVFRFAYIASQDLAKRFYANSQSQTYNTNNIVTHNDLNDTYFDIDGSATNDYISPKINYRLNGSSFATRPILDIELGNGLTGSGADTAGKGKYTIAFTNDLRNAFYFSEEFLQIISAANFGDWLYQVSGAGAQVINSDSTYVDGNHLGVITLETGTTTTGRAAIHTGSSTANAFTAGGGEMMFECNVRVPTISDGTETYTMRVGLGDSATAGHTDGIVFKHDNTTGNWQLVSSAAATASTVVTTTAVSTAAWVHLRITVNAAGTEVRGYIDGTEVVASSGTYPIVSNIPTGANKFAILHHIIKSAGTTNRKFAMDFNNMFVDLTSAR